MIPRILHSAWFGGGEKTDLFKRCIDSQRAVHPDWTFIETNEDNFGLWMQTPYVRAVLQRGDWVKATELARLVALQDVGGVYCDCDVEVLRPFDTLIADDARHRGFFLGRESAKYLNGAVMGAEPGHPVVTQLVRRFPAATDGRLGAHAYGPAFLTREIRRLKAAAHVLPPDFFFPYDFTQTPDQMVLTPNTYAAHHWAMSWVGKY